LNTLCRVAIFCVSMIADAVWLFYVLEYNACLGLVVSVRLSVRM